MIRKLSIRNLAIIRELEVTFGAGLNVLTGETGAGKSILIDALGLLLGEKATSDLVRTGAEQALVEGEFEEGDKSWIVRRILKPGGTSRMFIDEEPLKTTDLQDRAEQWVDLHGQHDHQSLLKIGTQLELLDAFAGLQPEREVLRHTYQHLLEARKDLHAKTAEVEKYRQQIEQDQFQLHELQSAKLQEGEDEQLSVEIKLLSQAQDLSALLENIGGRLQSDDRALPGEIAGLARQLARYADLSPELGRIHERLGAVKVELDDLAFETERFKGTLKSDPGRLTEVEQRLGELETIKRKYGGTIDAALVRQTSLAAKVAESSAGEAQLRQLRKTADRLQQSYSELCVQLSRQRSGASSQLAKDIAASLTGLDMPDIRFEVRLGQRANPDGLCIVDGKSYRSDDRGYDTVEFYMSANPGEELRPLAKIASGGEISRTMLGIKTVLAAYDPVGCLVFDEIDSGISGATADKVGAAIEALAATRQVICITHLPQIAARGGRHLMVRKQTRAGRTESVVEQLSESARRQEIARLLSGVEITQESLAQADKLLGSSQAAAVAQSGHVEV